MLEIRDLTKKFGKKTVLDQVNFTFEPGIYGLLGPNGAGKTTLLRCIAQIYPTPPNTILFEGTSIHNASSYLSHVGYLPQKFGMVKELSARDALLLMADLKGVGKAQADKRVAEVLELVHLSERAASRVGSLSGGMVRRLGIAQALLNDPKILLMDEPTTGLDPEERLRFKNILAELRGERVILLSTHIVEDVEALADQVAVMPSKQITVCGTCREIAEQAQGKVLLVPQEELSSIRGNYVIQKQLEQDSKIYVKILASEAAGWEPLKPSVEDGYMCVLNKI